SISEPTQPTSGRPSTCSRASDDRLCLFGHVFGSRLASRRCRVGRPRHGCFPCIHLFWARSDPLSLALCAVDEAHLIYPCATASWVVTRALTPSLRPFTKSILTKNRFIIG